MQQNVERIEFRGFHDSLISILNLFEVLPLSGRLLWIYVSMEEKSNCVLDLDGLFYYIWMSSFALVAYLDVLLGLNL